MQSPNQPNPAKRDKHLTMTGHPLLRLAFILLALGATAYPLARLTSKPAPTARPAAPSGPTEATPRAHDTTLTLTTTTPPSTVTITNATNTLATLTPTTNTTTIPLTLPTSIQGWDLIIRATWPNESPHALRVTTDAPSSINETYWSTANTLEEVLTLPAAP